MVEPEPCDFPGCKEPGAASLENRFLCREHFILTCYARLDACAQLLRERPFLETVSGRVRQSATECLSQASFLAGMAQTLTNLERARLLDIMLWATELCHRLRRSPRIPSSFPVRLRTEEPGRMWEEDSIARSVSRYGAALECEHPVRIGQTLLLIRKDTGEQTRARVLFRHSSQSGCEEIGIEFLDCENFWDLDWEAAESTG